jgi:hypothetical protein
VYKVPEEMAGPFRIVAQVSKLNYRIENPQGKKFCVNVNRLKKTNNAGVWQAKQRRKTQKREG